MTYRHRLLEGLVGPHLGRSGVPLQRLRSECTVNRARGNEVRARCAGQLKALGLEARARAAGGQNTKDKRKSHSTVDGQGLGFRKPKPTTTMKQEPIADWAHARGRHAHQDTAPQPTLGAPKRAFLPHEYQRCAARLSSTRGTHRVSPSGTAGTSQRHSATLPDRNLSGDATRPAFRGAPGFGAAHRRRGRPGAAGRDPRLRPRRAQEGLETTSGAYS